MKDELMQYKADPRNLKDFICISIKLDNKIFSNLWKNKASNLGMTELASHIRTIYGRIATFSKEILWSWTPYKLKRLLKERKKPPKEKRLRNIMPIII